MKSYWIVLPKQNLVAETLQPNENNLQPRTQSNFKKIAMAPHGFAGNFYLVWFVNCKTIEINLGKAVNFP